MTNREIMQAVLAGEQPETTPQWIMSLSSASLMKRIIPENLHYDGYSDYPEMGAYPFTAMGPERLAIQQKLNAHMDRVAFPVGWGANAAFGHCGPGEFNSKLLERDDKGFIVEYESGAKREVRINPHNVHTFELPINSPEDMDALELPDSNDPARYEGFAADVAWAKAHDEWTVGWVNGVFSGVHYFLRDYAAFFMDLALTPDFAKAMLKRVAEWNLNAVRHMCEAGVDCIAFCDDLGNEHAMLISPAMYREFIWPWHKEMCDLAHSHGAAVHMHSHGAIIPALPLLDEAGIDILNPLDPDDKMPMDEVRAGAGKRMVLSGGMNKHFFDGDRDTQAAFLRRLIDQGRRNGPHILMDSGGIPDNVTKEGFDAFLEMSREIRSS
jgi:uroporphyrinogen-III decarboxylase